MRRLYIILLIVTTVFVAACRKRAQTIETEKTDTVKFDTLHINKRVLLDSVAAYSPELKFNINLLVPNYTADDIASNISSCISYAAFGYEGLPVTVAADSIITSMTSEYLELRSEYINEKVANPDLPWFNAYYILNSSVHEGLNGCICYTVDYEIYSGGAHPNNIISCVNIDSKTGKEISLEKIFAEGTEDILIEKLIQRLAQQNNVGSLEELREKGFLTFSDMYITNNFMLDKDSLFFLYNSYEIAPYSMGRSRIGFKYDELKDLLK